MEKYYSDNLKILNHIEEVYPFFIARFSCGNEVDVVATGIKNKELESNAGIRCSTQESFQRYIDTCRKAFSTCTLICHWDGGCRTIGQDILMESTIPHHVPKAIARGLWAYYFLERENWVNALNGKSILIISPFVETIKNQLNVQEKLFYGSHYNWFQNCTFSFLKPPVTLAGNHENKEWHDHFEEFKEQLLSNNDFEVALVSCGGYGIPVCGFIYEEMNRSAIYMGGVLQMFFGICGGRWEVEEKTALDKYRNQYWTRPSQNEKPRNFQSIEGGCYW